MKFTKEEAIKELMAKIPEKGQTLNLSERSINEQIDTLLPIVATEEMELNDFVSKVLPIFKTADGNVKNDVSHGIKSFIDKNNKKEVTETKNEPGNEVQELLKRIESLEKESIEAKKNNRIAENKKKLFEKMKEKGISNAEWSNAMINEISIGDDIDIESKSNDLLKLYNMQKSKTRVQTPPNATGGGEDSYLNDVLKTVGNNIKSNSLIG